MKTFRDFNEKNVIKENYYKARKNQTLDFILKMKKKFSIFDKKMKIWDIFDKLNELIDISDPDCDIPNLYHALQTAEKMRKDNLPDWFQLTGLIHDIGKIMFLKGNDSEGTGKKEQWAMVGDTFIIGSPLPNSLVYPEFNKENSDSELDIYEKHCGLDNVHCSWGHDEYLYQILTYPKNEHSLPKEALYCIRFHSLYAYHDKKEYFQYQSEEDKKYFNILKQFNSYDLYSKSDEIFDINELKPYYETLFKKYFKNNFLYI